MSHAGPCTVHAIHAPRVNDVEIHHIHPLSHGGPDIPSNKISLCGTGHNNVHALLRQWLKMGGEPPWTVRQQFHPAERDLARLGYMMIMDYKALVSGKIS